MSLPAGALFLTAIPLPGDPTAEGYLPYGQDVPPPQQVQSPSTVFAPGGQNGQTVMLDAQGRRVLPYTPTADGRTLPGQVGPYAVLVPQLDNQTVVNVALPPDIAQFITANPPLDNAVALLRSLLSRIDTWSKEGCLAAGNVALAMTRLIGGYQRAVYGSSADTADLHTFLALQKTQFMQAAILFKARANEATGTASPLVQTAAQNAIKAVLNGDTNGVVTVPTTVQINPQLIAITQGVLVP